MTARLEDVLAHDPAALRCPYGAYAAEREGGVRFSTEADAFVVSSHDDVVEVLRDHRTFSSTITIGIPPIPPESEMARYVPLLLLSDDPDHARYRRIVSRAFTPSKIRAWEPQIARVCEELLDGLAGTPGIDFVRAFAIPLPITVITRVLGVPEKDAAAFRDWSDRLAASVGGHHVDRAEQLRVAKEFAAHLDPLLDAARDGTETSIFASIAAAETEDGLPRHDAARFVMELLVAGNITTTHHLSNSVLMLARDPDLAGRLRADPSQIPRFVEESLRLEAPIQGFYRLAMADAEIGGVTVPAGSRVLVLYASANRDPAAWPDADQTVPDRPNAASHLAFGRGVHACLGAALARAEGRIALEHLLRRLDRIELTTEPAGIEYLASAVNHGPARLPLGLTWASAAS